MPILGYATIPLPNGLLRVPVASIGDAPGPPIIRAQTALGKGQLGLVDRGDVRASGVTVQTQYGQLAIARDVRMRIDHTGSWVHSSQVYLGRTSWNRVTRIEAYVAAAWAELHCDAVHILFDPLECIYIRLRLEVAPVPSGVRRYGDWQLSASRCGRHYGELQHNSVRIDPAASGGLAIGGLPPAQYDVWVVMGTWITQEGSGAGIQASQFRVTSWSEIAA